jgi:hypothetical protein
MRALSKQRARILVRAKRGSEAVAAGVFRDGRIVGRRGKRREADATRQPEKRRTSVRRSLITGG